MVTAGAVGSTTGSGTGGQGATVVGAGGRSPTSAGPMIAGAQHLGQPLYQEYAHAVRPRAHPVPPPVYVTAAPSQAPTAIQQQQLSTYQGFTPGWVPRHLVDACTCVPIYYSSYSRSHLTLSHLISFHALSSVKILLFDLFDLVIYLHCFSIPTRKIVYYVTRA